jgi:hypothetical protein
MLERSTPATTFEGVGQIRMVASTVVSWAT